MPVVVLLLLLAVPFSAQAQTTAAPSLTHDNTCGGTVTNCRICYNSTTYPCIDCEAGYTRTKQGRCVAGAACEVAHCLSCPTSTTHCATCASGYYRTVAGGCVEKRYPNGAALAVASSQAAWATACACVVAALAVAL